MRLYQLLLVMGCFLLSPAVYAADGKIRVVATQTIFADVVRQIGGDKVEVTAVASPKFNIHFIQPTPRDVRTVARADLYVNGGLDLEAWSDSLLEAAGKPELFRHGPRNVDVSRGVRLLNVPKQGITRAQGDIHLFGNPHFHMNPENIKVMANNILDRLREIDPVNASFYQQNTEILLTKLDQKITEWKTICSVCKDKEIISYHDDIAYFADFLGLKSTQFLEPKPGIPPTPKHLQFLKEYMNSRGIRVIVMPTYISKNAAESLSRLTDGRVVTVCQSVGGVAGTEDIFRFFDYNIQQIIKGVQ